MLKSRHLLQVKRLNIFYYGAFMRLPALTLKNVPRLQLRQLRASTPSPDEIRKEK